MAMEHKAYAFDWSRFESDLRPLLVRALTDDDPAALEAYIDRHRNELRAPYEGGPLPADWREALENRDVHEYGDYALTRFYYPAHCSGVGYEWERLSDELPKRAVDALLGFSIGPPERLFDPGRYGSYFQTSAQVRESLATLKPLKMLELAEFIGLLERCAAEGRGVYTTF